MVNAYTQNLGVQSHERGFCGLVRRDLACSDWCPGHGEKGQDHIPSAQIAQRELLIHVRLQGEIRSLCANLYNHLLTPQVRYAILP